MKNKERDLQIAAVDFLRLALPPDCFFFHVPNGGPRPIVAAVLLKKMGTRAGVPDLIFLGAGIRPFCIELKAKGGHISPAQAETIAALAQAGARTFICRSLEEVAAAVESSGVKLRARLSGDASNTENQARLQ